MENKVHLTGAWCTEKAIIIYSSDFTVNYAGSSLKENILCHPKRP